MTINNNSFGLDLVWKAFTARKWHIFFFALASLGAILLFSLAFFSLASKETYFGQKVQILLPKKSSVEGFTYPSGKPFNRLDIISAPVLRKVYEQNRLESKLTFEEFEKLFSVINYSDKRASLEANYAVKLNRRNLSLVDLKLLEEEYQSALTHVDDNNYRIIMFQEGLPPALAAKVLGDIPQAWFEIYAKQESDKLPMVKVDKKMQDYFQQEVADSYLIALDRLRFYVSLLQNQTASLETLLNNRNLSLPTGETFENLQNSLFYIQNYQLGMLQQLVLSSPAFHNKLDIIYIQGRIANEQLKLDNVKMRKEAVLESLNALQNPETAGKGAREGKTGEPAAFTLDSSVLNHLALLYMRDSSTVLRKELADKNLLLGQEVASLSSMIEYYQQILRQLESKTEAGGHKDEASLKESFAALYRELVELSECLNAFQKMLTTAYISSQSYYTFVGEASLFTSRLVSMKMLGAGALLVWILLNAFYASVQIYRNLPEEETENAE